MQTTTTVRTLRSVRHFTDDPVADEMVERWVDTARWTGSSKNTQPWRFIAVRHRPTLVALSRLGHHADHIASCAVALAIVACRTGVPYSVAMDVGRVSQSLMLIAHEDGIGACVAVLEPQDRVDEARRLLGVESDLDLDVVISFGRPAAEPPLPAGVERVSPLGRRSTADLLSWEVLRPKPSSAAGGDQPQ